MTVRKYLLPIVTILFGLMLTILGALFKIMHWSYASILLTFGMFLEALGILILIIKLIQHSKKDQ